MREMRGMMGRLKLEVNEAKSGVRWLASESVDFLCYTIGWR